MQSIDDLFASFGGPRPLSEKTGIGYSTVNAFKSRNSIPEKYWKTIEAHARASGIEGVDRYTICDLMLRQYPDVEVGSKGQGKPRPAARVSADA